ncbi:MAG: hypothetical protein C0600_02880, partial [Ignavibacteria bacterium]
MPRHGHMNLDLFQRLMDEIDAHGARHIALHKDGEPLLHPDIISMLERVKARHEHHVYLTTNAQRMEPNVIDAILRARIDTVNFSIGAASEEFYGKVRGCGFKRVIENI